MQAPGEKPPKNILSAGDPAAHQAADQLLDHEERGGQGRFVRFQRREMTLGTTHARRPAVASHASPGSEGIGNPEYVLGRRPPAVQDDDGGARAGNLFPRVQNGLVLVDGFCCHGLRIYPAGR